MLQTPFQMSQTEISDIDADFGLCFEVILIYCASPLVTPILEIELISEVLEGPCPPRFVLRRIFFHQFCSRYIGATAGAVYRLSNYCEEPLEHPNCSYQAIAVIISSRPLWEILLGLPMSPLWSEPKTHQNKAMHYSKH